jgi:hypothetical protein
MKIKLLGPTAKCNMISLKLSLSINCKQFVVMVSNYMQFNIGIFVKARENSGMQYLKRSCIAIV